MIEKLRKLKRSKIREFYNIRMKTTGYDKAYIQMLNNEITAINTVISILKAENVN